MALVDVTDVLSDPDFIDPVTLIHRSSQTNNLGENKLHETSVPTYGTVQPISGKHLERIPEALRVQDEKSFWLKGKILSDGKCKYPDIILHNGSRYAVRIILDWTTWGGGWCEGTCVREEASL